MGRGVVKLEKTRISNAGTQDSFRRPPKLALVEIYITQRQSKAAKFFIENYGTLINHRPLYSDIVRDA
jgi:hypothetical protein